MDPGPTSSWFLAEGWGLAVRWVTGVVLTVRVIVWLGGLVLATVQSQNFHKLSAFARRAERDAPTVAP